MKFPLNPQQNPIQGPCKSSQRNVQEVFIELIKCTWNSMKFPAKNQHHPSEKPLMFPLFQRVLPSTNHVFPSFSIVSPWFPCHFPWEHPIPWRFHVTASERPKFQVENIRRFGGSTSPAMPWPAEEHTHGDGAEDKLDRLEKIILRATKMLGMIWWCGFGSIPINTIFSGMNIHKSQLWLGVHQGYYWFWHIPISSVILI